MPFSEGKKLARIANFSAFSFQIFFRISFCNVRLAWVAEGGYIKQDTVTTADDYENCKFSHLSSFLRFTATPTFTMRQMRQKKLKQRFALMRVLTHHVRLWEFDGSYAQLSHVLVKVKSASVLKNHSVEQSPPSFSFSFETQAPGPSFSKGGYIALFTG